MSIFGTFKELFESSPQPVRTANGMYECRRCKKRFESGPCNPCRANIGASKMVGDDYYWRTLTHTCEASRPDREAYGVADLVGATVTTEYPTTVANSTDRETGSTSKSF